MEHAKEPQKQLETAAESTVSTPATVAQGHGYPANRLESSQEPTGWLASGEQSNFQGSIGERTKVSRETSG
jgi:hypothetical protein